MPFCFAHFLVLSSFLETSVPLLVLIEAATAGNEKEVEECAVVFKEHANKLVEVSAIFVVLSLDDFSFVCVILKSDH